ncbi:hypothetical protein [Maribacter cobaltidurans]|uniref:Uncharacterized protein n=1 Tax=Maribacter cobaltidurans TaxID=1178778 RepID=A0A223V678_9FLAO|nr:hypothetical protein [Maribacter cobaltidurans]ASV30816.1 hypothetical protein CJ263_11635 [Maribacter cobaltidurans]GGD81985.1 hypothetical protein GCM10011412_19730 [Maribacter cobaltidurans]
MKECHEKDIKTSWHSLNRAFSLRELLNDEISADQVYSIPKKETLDALTKYSYGNEFIFRDLIEPTESIGLSKAEILRYYEINRPNSATMAEIFRTKPEKIEHIRDQQDIYTHLKLELESKLFKDFISERVREELEISFGHFQEDLERKAAMIKLLENKIDKLTKQRSLSTLIYRFFGSVGLFFVAIDYDMVSKESVLEEFFDDHSIILGDDSMNDLV